MKSNIIFLLLILVIKMLIIKTNTSFLNFFSLVRDNLIYNTYFLIVLIYNLRKILLLYIIFVSIFSAKVFY